MKSKADAAEGAPIRDLGLVPVPHWPIPRWRIRSPHATILTTLLHPPKPRHADLDSAFIHVPTLADKLVEERFNGLIRLVHGQSWGVLALSEGRVVLAFYAGEWDGLPVEETWLSWVSAAAVKIHVDEMVRGPLALWHRHALRDFAVEMQLVDHRGEILPSDFPLPCIVDVSAGPSRGGAFRHRALSRFPQPCRGCGARRRATLCGKGPSPRSRFGHPESLAWER